MDLGSGAPEAQGLLKKVDLLRFPGKVDQLGVHVIGHQVRLVAKAMPVETLHLEERSQTLP